jgi:hypothetical protein
MGTVAGPAVHSKKNNNVGAWRSLVAHLHGVQGVPSSNLGAPTSFSYVSVSTPNRSDLVSTQFSTHDNKSR